MPSLASLFNKETKGLPTNVYSTMKESFETVIEVLGTPVRLESADGVQSLDLLAGMRSVGRGDTDIVNAYGLDVRVFTFRYSDLGVFVPNEFDKVLVTHSSLGYTLNSVHEIYLNADMIGYRCIARADR